MLIAALMVVLNIVNTSGEYLFGRYVVEQANAQFSDPVARQRFIGETYSYLFSTVNLLGFLLQMFVVSRVFKFLGVGRSLFIHPMVALTGYLLMMRTPSVQLMSALKIADNSIDYSLGNTTKQALWLPTSREAKYKAKQAVDSFFVRMGDVIQAGVVFVGERLAMAVPAFAVGERGAVGRVAGRRRAAQRRAARQGRRHQGASLTRVGGRAAPRHVCVIIVVVSRPLCVARPARDGAGRLGRRLAGRRPGATHRPARGPRTADPRDHGRRGHRHVRGPPRGRRHPVHAGHDRPSRAGARDGGPGRLAQPQRGPQAPGAAD